MNSNHLNCSSTSSVCIKNSSTADIKKGLDVVGRNFNPDERYSVWRKNAPFFYSSFLSHKLDWPSLSVSFIPSSNTRFPSLGSGKSFNSRVIFGTCTGGQDVDFCIIGDIKWPSSCVQEDPLSCETYCGFLPPRLRLRNAAARDNIGTTPAAPSFEIRAKIVHSGDVNRICVSEYNSLHFCTFSSNSFLCFFNFAKHPSFPPKLHTSSPQLVLAHHNREGYGLCWSKDPNKVLSCALDGFICKWDINAHGQGAKHSPVLNRFSFLTNSTQTFSPNRCDDSRYILGPHRKSSSVIKSKLQCDNQGLSVSQHTECTNTTEAKLAEGTTCISPVEAILVPNESSHISSSTRNFESTNRIQSSTQDRYISQNDIDQSPFFAEVCATAGEDGSIRLWDFRCKSKKQTIVKTSCMPSIIISTHGVGGKTQSESKKHALNCISFSPHCDTVCATGGENGHILLYDLRNTKFPLYVCFHHSDSINRVSFCPTCSSLIGSASQDGTVAISNINKIMDKSGNYFRIPVVTRKGNSNQSMEHDSKHHGLFFVHGGHSNAVCDFKWNAVGGFPLTASVGWDNRLQVWQIAENILIE